MLYYDYCCYKNVEVGYDEYDSRGSSLGVSSSLTVDASVGDYCVVGG